LKSPDNRARFAAHPSKEVGRTRGLSGFLKYLKSRQETTFPALWMRITDDGFQPVQIPARGA
jgi:hypothetical protein